jgi:hypothetical protein
MVSNSEGEEQKWIPLPVIVTHPGTEKFYTLAVSVKSLPSENGLTEGMLLRSILGMK